MNNPVPCLLTPQLPPWQQHPDVQYCQHRSLAMNTILNQFCPPRPHNLPAMYLRKNIQLPRSPNSAFSPTVCFTISYSLSPASHLHLQPIIASFISKSLNHYVVGRDSVIGTATRYGLEGSDLNPSGNKTFRNVQQGPRACPASYTTANGSYLEVKWSERGIWHRGQRKSKPIPHLVLCAFIASYRVNFNYNT